MSEKINDHSLLRFPLKNVPNETKTVALSVTINFHQLNMTPMLKGITHIVLLAMNFLWHYKIQWFPDPWWPQ